jgi:hypothetical protein
VLSLRVSRDKRGYDHIYLLLETRRKGRTVTRLLYGGRWPSPMKIGQQPLDEAMRKTLEQAYPEVTFDWAALQRTLQQALATPRAPMTPETRRRRAEGREGRPPSSGPVGGGQSYGGQSGRSQQGQGRVPPASRPQMPPRQRPPYAAGAPGFGDQAEQRQAYGTREPRDPSLDDTADLPFGAVGGMETDSDVVDLPVRPYDEPILEEGLESEPRRVGFAEMPAGPEEIEPVEERTFVVSTSDDDTGELALVSDEPVDDRGGFEPAEFERPELPGPGFTIDEFPVAAAESPQAEQGGGPDLPRNSLTSGLPSGGLPPGGAADPLAPPRRRRRRRRGGRRSHGGPNAAPQQGDGPSPGAGGEPDDAESGPDGHDDESDV